MTNVSNFHVNYTNSSSLFVINKHVVYLEEHIKQLQNISANVEANENTLCPVELDEQIDRRQERTYRQIVSGLEQVIWVEDPFVVRPQMGANSFAWSKAHFDGDLGPAPLLADCIEAALFIHELEKRAFGESGPQT